MIRVTFVFRVVDGAYATLGAFTCTEQINSTGPATAFLALSRALCTNALSGTVVLRCARIVGAFLTPFGIGSTSTGTLIVFETIALST
jgi:hypothetical protein